MGDKINSAADNAFPQEGQTDRDVNTNYPIGVQAPMPHINTVSDSDVGDTPDVNSGGQEPPTVKSVNLAEDGGGDSIKSAA